MADEFRLPDLGEGLTEGEVARWLVAEGDQIDEDQPLVEIQTDKATVEIPSPYAGTVLKILVPDGGVVPVGTVLVVIGEAGEQLLRSVASTEDQAIAGAVESPAFSVVQDQPTAAVRATPAVRKLASELGVDLLSIVGSGAEGRVTEADVRAAGGPAEGRRVPIRGIRRLILEHTSITQREVPAVTYVEECDFTGSDLGTLVARALHAAAGSLQECPELNARIEGDDIVLLDRYDLGVAVQTDEGLVVPVVRGCDALTVEEIHAEVQRLAESAREGTLAPDELRGSTFTITSAGRLGGLFVTPLINYPEVGILGVHRVGPRPVVRDGEIVVREMGNVSVTFDHRVVDGLRAAQFCLDVIERLSSPAE